MPDHKVVTIGTTTQPAVPPQTPPNILHRLGTLCHHHLKSVIQLHIQQRLPELLGTVRVLLKNSSSSGKEEEEGCKTPIIGTQCAQGAVAMPDGELTLCDLGADFEEAANEHQANIKIKQKAPTAGRGQPHQQKANQGLK